MRKQGEASLPFVSIIVPVYNGAETITACLDSLLAQDYPRERFEIIVVDNASKDNTRAIVEPYTQNGRVKLLSETKILNAYGARNTGAVAASGEILAFTDADCVADPCWLTELVAGFDINNLFAPGYEDGAHRHRIVKALDAADHITADSPEVLKRCELLVGRNLNTSLFYFGIDLNLFRPGHTQEAQHLRQQLDIPPRARVILSIRALRPLMGHHYVLEAFSQLVSDPRLPETVLVLKHYLPFADGYEDELKKQICELGLNERVRWLEAAPNDQMPIQYAMADVIVNYPERDGFPVTFFEAAACRRPVVTSCLPAYDGVFGADTFWLAPPGNASALADALRTSLTTEPAQVKSCLDRALSRVQEVGDQRNCFESINNVYRNLTR